MLEALLAALEPLFGTVQVSLDHGNERLVEGEGEPGILAEIDAVPECGRLPGEGGLGGGIGRRPVDGENVQVQAEGEDILPFALDADGQGVFHLGESIDKPMAFLRASVQAAVTASAVVRGGEMFEIRTGHHDVDVVVPRDESLVAHGPEKRPVGKGIAQSVCAAEAVDILEDGQQKGMDFRKFDSFHGSRLFCKDRIFYRCVQYTRAVRKMPVFRSFFGGSSM